jgi:hypothetical protein
MFEDVNMWDTECPDFVLKNFIHCWSQQENDDEKQNCHSNSKSELIQNKKLKRTTKVQSSTKIKSKKKMIHHKNHPVQ